MPVRDVILKPRDEAKDLPRDVAARGWCGKQETRCHPIHRCPDHFALCALHFEMDEPTELPKFAKTPSHRRHVTGRFFAALRMT
jgi:hypothetical protein